jgi:hypothetical protein
MGERIADAVDSEVDNGVRVAGRAVHDVSLVDDTRARLADERPAPSAIPNIDPSAPPIAIRELQADLERWNVAQGASRSTLQSPAFDRQRERVQSVDPRVSRSKFDRELDAYRRHEEAYRSRGWLLIEAVFPRIFFVLCVPQLKPQCVLFGVVLDFTNYDVEPISVKVVDAFTKRSLLMKELLTVLPRKPRTTSAQIQERMSEFSPESPDDPQLDSPALDACPRFIEVPGLLQAWGPNDSPFLCLPGVLEYHHHPAHSGDSWLRYRGSPVGKLDAILNAFHTYGVRPINSYNVNFSLQQYPDGTASIAGVQIKGFGLAEVPE